jgi:hypothetical protein
MTGEVGFELLNTNGEESNFFLKKIKILEMRVISQIENKSLFSKTSRI